MKDSTPDEIGKVVGTALECSFTIVVDLFPYLLVSTVMKVIQNEHFGHCNLN